MLGPGIGSLLPIFLCSYTAAKVVEDDETLQFLGDIVPPKVLVKDFLESLKKKSRMSPVDVGSSSSESE